MYVCMCVCMYVCMYVFVFMSVSMYVCIYVCMYVLYVDFYCIQWTWMTKMDVCVFCFVPFGLLDRQWWPYHHVMLSKGY